jgi:hypothetical protein
MNTFDYETILSDMLPFVKTGADLLYIKNFIMEKVSC